MTSTDLHKLLKAWLADTSNEEEEPRSGQKVEDEYAREVATLTETLAPVAPSNRLRSKLMASLAETSRFDDLAEKIAALIDRSLKDARELAHNIDSPPSWEAGPFPGVELFHIDGGPAVENAIVGFVRIEPGMTFPEHRHVGKEWKFVVQGGFREDSGRIFRRGDLCISDPETTHDLTALPDGPPLIYLVVLMEGLEIAGLFIGPEDTRF